MLADPARQLHHFTLASIQCHAKLLSPFFADGEHASHVFHALRQQADVIGEEQTSDDAVVRESYTRARAQSFDQRVDERDEQQGADR